MKFLCPNCKAKYQISDEKIAGRTLKMDCRRCNHPIVIRNENSRGAARRPSSSSLSAVGAQRKRTSHVGPAPTRSSRSSLGADFRKNVSAAPPSPQRPTALDQWHVAINDVPVGPMKREEVSRKIAGGAINGQSLCWREGFDDWRELRDVPELAALLQRVQTAKRPPAPPAAGFPAPSRSLGGRPGPRVRPPASRAAAPARPAADPNRAAARGNVVAIGGRLGGGAAPSLDDEYDNEPTRVGTAIDFDKMEAEARATREAAARAEMERKVAEARAAEAKAKEEAARARADNEALLKQRTPAPIPGASLPAAPPPGPGLPPPSADLDELDGAAAMASASPEPASNVPTGLGGYSAPSDAFDPFVQPPAPGTPAPAASVAAPPQPMYAQPDYTERRRRQIPIAAWIAIAGAMSFGVALAIMVGSKLLTEPTPVAVVDPTPVPQPPTDPVGDDLVLAVPDEPGAEDTGEDIEEPPEDGEGGDEPAGGNVARPASNGERRTPRPNTNANTNPTPNPAPRPSGLSAAQQEALRRAAGDSAEDGPALDSVPRRPGVLDEGGPRGRQELTGEQVASVVQRHRGEVQRCYETETRASGQAPSMRVDVGITIGASGAVTRASARAGQSFGNLNTCIERYVRRWRFPVSSGETSTSIPFVFSGRE